LVYVLFHGAENKWQIILNVLNVATHRKAEPNEKDPKNLRKDVEPAVAE